MRRAIALGMRGRGGVEPNPMVGCVIVAGVGSAARIIGEGFHRRFGQPHAEPDALANCIQDPRGATAYVTLEPCCHTEKKTPPCVPRLIAAGLGRVVIGCLDPNPRVNGRGAAQLREAGITVDTSCMESECRQLIAPFIAGTIHRRPYVTLKWAQSADGFIAGEGGRRVQISSPDANRVVHELRARCDAILIGAQTAVNDDPLLSARDVPSSGALLRCIIDPRLRLTPALRLFQTAGKSPVIIYHGPASPDDPRLAALRLPGVRTVPMTDLQRILVDLHSIGVAHLLVESGGRLAKAFVDANLADRTWVIRSLVSLNCVAAPRAIASPYSTSASRQVGPDVLSESLNPRSDVFFAAVPSADMALIV